MTAQMMRKIYTSETQVVSRQPNRECKSDYILSTVLMTQRLLTQRNRKVIYYEKDRI